MKLSPGQMGGVVVKAESVVGLRLTETFCPANHKAPKHWHELFHFCLIRDGSYTEYCGRKVRECAAYSLISHPPGEVHSSLYHSRGAGSFVIEIEGSWLELARQHSVVLEEAVYFRSGTPVWLGARLYDEFPVWSVSSDGGHSDIKIRDNSPAARGGAANPAAR